MSVILILVVIIGGAGCSATTLNKTEPRFIKPVFKAQKPLSTTRQQNIKNKRPSLPPSLRLKLKKPSSVVLPALTINKAPPKNPAKAYWGGTQRPLPKSSRKDKELRWQKTSLGPLWRLQITSTGARGVFIPFESSNVGKGQIWIHSPQGQTDGPYTSQSLHEHGVVSSHIFAGDTLTVEYLAASRIPNKNSTPFRITRIGHMWKP